MPGRPPDAPMQACIDWLQNRRDHLTAFARLQAGNDLDAEELLAETVKNIARALADRRLPGDPEAMTPYAFTCMRHTAANWRKRTFRRNRSEQAYGDEEARTEESRPWLQVTADADDLQRRLASHLEKLPKMQAEIVMMKIWNNLSTTEIARITGTPKTTVDSRYHHALDKLRRMIADDPDTQEHRP